MYLKGLALLVQIAMVLWPLAAFIRMRQIRFLGLSLVGLFLLIDGVLNGDSGTGLGNLGISVLAFCLVLVAVHVSCQRLAEYEALKSSEALNRLTLESVSDAVFISDDDGVLTHVWPGLSELFEGRGESVGPGSRLQDLFPKDPVNRAELGQEGEIRDIPTPIPGPDGSDRRLLMTVKRVEIQGGTILYVCRDVTQTTKMEGELERALAEVRALKDRLEAEASYLHEEFRAEHSVEGIIGASSPLKQMLQAIQAVADTESAVLILGETGSGKDLVAHAIHELSARADRSLVKVNCASLPPNLIESELFGHERGAFTGATSKRLGRFELADKGTLFLDEVGELPLALQPKLLRVLQDGELQRVGGSDTRSVDVRVLAATNRDLRKEVEEGRFRSDLFFRLEVFPIMVPPLRERRNDIPLLANHFLREIGTSLGRTFEGFTKASHQAMLSYDWPGNIRELKNVVERAAILTREGLLELSPFLDSDPSMLRSGRADRPSSLRLDDVIQSHITEVLREVDWKIEGAGGAAEVLALNPSTLRARMRKLGIRRPTI